MPILYSLYKNHLTNGSNQYRGAVQVLGGVDVDDVIERMIDRGSTTTRADALAVLQDYHAAIESLLLEGFNVNTPYVCFGASIKGVFDGPSDSFDPDRHSIEPRVNAGPELRRFVKTRLHAQKTEANKVRPNPVEYTDLNTGQTNTVLTPGGMGQITGHRLKTNLDNPEEGIFFTANGSSYRVSIVGNNTPTRLMFLVPADVPPGEYELSVRCLYGLDDLRSGRLGAKLVVS